MEYTIQKLSRLASVSKRTLRYYDELGLLKPSRINSSGYRIYGSTEVSRLQQILFYRELGIGLDAIKDIIDAPGFNAANALREHHERLIVKREQLDLLIANVEKTIAASEGRIQMSDEEKFEGFKRKLLDDNEKEYGNEVRKKYGDETAGRSNAKFAAMTEKQYDEATKLSEAIIATLLSAHDTNDPTCELAQKAADMHRRWLCFYWDEYSREAHAGLAQMYVEDDRFRMNYDKHRAGLAEFFRDAINVYTGTAHHTAAQSQERPTDRQ